MEKEHISKLEQWYIKFNAPNASNRTAFFRLLAITQKAWLGIRESLYSIERSETHAGMRRILVDLIKRVNQWNNISSAMEANKHFFTWEEIELIRSSETMWNLPEVLNNIAEELENYQKIVWKIKSAATYPTVVLIFAIIAVIVLLLKVMPTIVTLFPNKESLPWITKFMLGASDFIKTKWPIIIIVVPSIFIGYKFLYSTVLWFKKFIDKLVLEIPNIKKVYRRFNLYRFSKLLWDFYNAWVSPTEALNQISTVLSNYHYQKKVRDIKQDLELWLSFTEAMEWSWLFDPILVQIIWVWEQTWNIWEVLNKMASFYKEELNTWIEWLMKMIEPIMMAVVAVVIWIIVASVFLPMGDLIWQIWG